MTLKTTVIPLDGGHDTTIDKRLSGLSRFRTVLNGRLDADGRIISRARYVQIPSTTYGSGTFDAYDLFEVDSRLCALGDRLSLGFPTDVFEFVSGGGASWKPSDVVTTGFPRLPRATGLRELPRPPDQQGGVSGYDVAALGGFVLLVYTQLGGLLIGYSILMRAAEGQTVLVRELTGAVGPRRFLRSVALNTRFWVIGLNQDMDQVRGDRIDPATDTSWTSGPSLISGLGDFSIIEAAKVGGLDQFVVAAITETGTLRVRRFDNAGTVVVPSGGQYADVAGLVPTFLAVEADNAGNSVNVAVVHSGTLRVYSYNLATGATIGGAATPAEAVGETATNVALTRSSSTTLHVLATLTTVGTPDVPSVYRWIYTVASQTFGAEVSLAGVKLASQAVQPNAGLVTAVFGVVTDDPETSPNMLLEHGASDTTVTPLATKDLGIAAPPVALTPKIASDTSVTPTRYYWVAGVESNDGASIPVVCELRLTDPARRQVAKVGLGAIIAGAAPTWYDGTQIVESGFTQRPRIVSLASSNGSGALLPGATYSYRAVQSWFDAGGRIHRSPVSLPVDITMGASDDQVAAVVSGLITMRFNAGSAAIGSTTRTELYRTRTIQTNTAATVLGANVVDPPSASLNGQTLQLFVTDSLGTDPFVVTFDAGDIDPANIAAQINAVTTTRLIATNSAGRIRLTTVETGASTLIQIFGTTGATILGFPANTTATGTTENERGETFHLTKVDYVAMGTGAGARNTVIDIRDDGTSPTGLASQAVLYTQLESPLGDHAPPPADYVWWGNERVELAGLPKRAGWESSKLVDTVRAVAFTPAATPGFSGELAESVEAVVVQDVSKLYLTRRSIWQVDGEGPAENGRGGFFASRRVFTEGGLVANGWRSLLETSAGMFFQLDGDKLYSAPPGGTPQWTGFAIRELLRLFPVIVAATLTQNDQVAAFALQNTAGSAGRIALYDLRRQVWFIDVPGAVPQALADYQGRLCYVDENRDVFIQDEVAGTGTFIPLTLETGFATDFGVGGQGALPTVLLCGELLGECTLELQVNYDGAGFVTAGTFALTIANGYAVGQTIREEFELAQQDCSSFALQILVTGTTDSAGLALIALVVFTERENGPALLGNAFRR